MSLLCTFLPTLGLYLSQVLSTVPTSLASYVLFIHTHTHTIVLLYCFLDALTFKLAPLHCNGFDIDIFIVIKFNVLDVRHQR